MKITKYNITLKRLESSDLEILRDWRNSDYVNSRMIATDYITVEDQLNWFKTINNDQNYYFIAEYNNEKVGLIHVKNISQNKGEGGIFLASEKFENGDLVPRMIMCFNDFIFEDLKLDFIYSQVRADNKKAISSSIAQGCVVNKETTTDDIISFLLYPENYHNKTKKIKQILQRNE
jgi:RimJ/RimL family protein N-acetyltransferase